jgi:hypothetical protein
MADILAGTICVECKTRQATEVVSSGDLAASRGLVKPWCALCLARAQLKHARSRAAEIPKLESQIKELEGAEGK